MSKNSKVIVARYVCESIFIVPDGYDVETLVKNKLVNIKWDSLYLPKNDDPNVMIKIEPVKGAGEEDDFKFPEEIIVEEAEEFDWLAEEPIKMKEILFKPNSDETESDDDDELGCDLCHKFIVDEASENLKERKSGLELTVCEECYDEADPKDYEWRDEEFDNYHNNHKDEE